VVLLERKNKKFWIGFHQKHVMKLPTWFDSNLNNQVNFFYHIQQRN
jgi:hypothetical protein